MNQNKEQVNKSAEAAHPGAPSPFLSAARLPICRQERLSEGSVIFLKSIKLNNNEVNHGSK